MAAMAARRTPNDVVVVGLTGGICAGKTTATKMFEEVAGAVVLNADLFGHEAYLPGTRCLAEMVAHFGERIINSADGTVDRKTLGGIVFGDPNEMKALNAIVWPAIRALLLKKVFEVAEAMPANPSGFPKLIVIEAAVMIEANWTDLADEIWVLTAPRELAKARLMERNKLSEADAVARIDSQISNEERQAAAHVVISNDDGQDVLVARLSEALGRLKERYSKLSAFEFVDVVSKEDQVLGHAKRAVVRDFDLIYRCTYVVLVHGASGRVYVQRRSMLKDSGPGLLDPAPGGVVGAGESYEANARREMAEEMGIANIALSHVCAMYHEHATDGRSWGTVFCATVDHPVAELVLQESEVESVQLMTLAEVLAAPEGLFLPCGLAAFKKYVASTGSA